MGSREYSTLRAGMEGEGLITGSFHLEYPRASMKPISALSGIGQARKTRPAWRIHGRGAGGVAPVRAAIAGRGER